MLAAALVLGVATRVAASPGNGIRLGGSEGRLHPYLELETRYDSNVVYTDPGKSVGDLILHVRPGLTLDSPGQQVAVNARANLDWAQYLGLEGKTTNLSRLYGEAGLGVGVNRRGTIGLEFTDTFSRSSSTDAFTLGSAVISNSNALHLAAPWRPGGGALEVTPAVDWRLVTYEAYLKGQLCTDGTANCNTADMSKLGYSDVTGSLEGRWKFLPRTAAVLQLEYFEHLPSSAAEGDSGSGARAWTGLAGLFSAHVAGTVKAGYADTFGSFGSAYRTWLANVEAEWLPLETASLKLGYLHDLAADPGLKSLYSTHRLYTEGRVLLSGRYSIRLGGSYEHRTYELVSSTSADLFQVQPSVEAELARWLRVGVGYAYTKRTSSFTVTTAALPGYDYSKNEVWARITGTY